jgi:hypothetical protein
MNWREDQQIERAIEQLNCGELHTSTQSMLPVCLTGAVRTLDGSL